MPIQVAYLIGVTCITLTCRALYRRLSAVREYGEGPFASATVAALAGVPLGALVATAPVLALCLVFGPVHG